MGGLGPLGVNIVVTRQTGIRAGKTGRRRGNPKEVRVGVLGHSQGKAVRRPAHRSPLVRLEVHLLLELEGPPKTRPGDTHLVGHSGDGRDDGSRFDASGRKSGIGRRVFGENGGGGGGQRQEKEWNVPPSGRADSGQKLVRLHLCCVLFVDRSPVRASGPVPQVSIPRLAQRLHLVPPARAGGKKVSIISPIKLKLRTYFTIHHICQRIKQWR